MGSDQDILEQVSGALGDDFTVAGVNVTPAGKRRVAILDHEARAVAAAALQRRDPFNVVGCPGIDHAGRVQPAAAVGGAGDAEPAHRLEIRRGPGRVECGPECPVHRGGRQAGIPSARLRSAAARATSSPSSPRTTRFVPSPCEPLNG